jgi:hypothetical protein
MACFLPNHQRQPILLTDRDLTSTIGKKPIGTLGTIQTCVSISSAIFVSYKGIDRPRKATKLLVLMRLLEGSLVIALIGGSERDCTFISCELHSSLLNLLIHWRDMRELNSPRSDDNRVLLPIN